MNVYSVINVMRPDSYNSISLGAIFGQTLNPYGRIKFPLFVGPSLSYENFGPIHNLTLSMQGRARIKYFITRKFGVFVGLTGRYGWGSKKAHKYGVKAESTSESLGLNAWQFGLETGLSLSLN